MIRSTLRPFASLLFLTLHFVDSTAYITLPGAVPARRQIKFLKEMTVDICQVKPGQLSQHQLSQAPELMHAWSHVHYNQVNKKECALAVESLAKRVIDERRAGNERADLSVRDYNCLLEGWARSRQGQAAAERCEQILGAMQEHGLQPDLSSFKYTLMAWRQAGSATAYSPQLRTVPHRASRILEWMIRLYQEGENTEALPDADCFDIVLQTWSRSGHEQAPEQTEQILVVMERLYRRTQSEQVKPRHSSFNAVLAAWCKSGRSEGADRAVSILSFMEQVAAHGDSTIAPDPASYNTVMSAFVRSENKAFAAGKANTLLRHAEQAYHANPSNFALETILFNSAMGAWAKSNKHGAFRKARSILDRQIALYESGCTTCKPDVFGYTSVMASCAAEPGNKDARAKAFHVAMKTYEELKRCDDGPNQVSFGIMLKACARLLPPGSKARRKVARTIFRECCEAGCVGDMVVSRLRETVPESFKDLMKGNGKRTLPMEWTRNVDEKNEYRKKKTRPRRKRAEV